MPTMMTDDAPASYGTAHDPRPTVAQVLAAYEAACEYWNEDREAMKEAA